LSGLALAAVVLALCSCSTGDAPPYKPSYGDSPPSGGSVYIFAPHPLLNPQKTAVVFGAIVDRINADLTGRGIKLKLEASRNYASFNEKLRKRLIHFALPNPYQTLLSQEYGYRILAKDSDDSDFCGLILMRRDNPIDSVPGLKGETVSFPAPTALAGTLMPELYLKENGLDPRREITQAFVGTHESALVNVGIGASAAACTWPPAWESFQREHPELARRIEIRWRTGTLPSNGFVVRDDVPEAVRREVMDEFFALNDSPEGRRLLRAAAVAALVPADEAAYAPVRAFIQRYEKAVRPLKGLNE
jgi:phosphonate transport system substrate-binding protein